MNPQKKVAFLGAVIALSLSAASVAGPIGSVARIDGTALISADQGAQYRTASEGMQINARDSIMTMDGSSVVLSFADGCQHDMKGNEVLVLGQGSTCADDSFVSYKVGPYYAQGNAVGGGAAGAGAAAAAGGGAAAAGGVGAALGGAGALAVGGGVVVGGAVVAKGGDSSNSDPVDPDTGDPVSP